MGIPYVFRATMAKHISDSDVLEISSTLVDGVLLYAANSRTLITEDASGKLMMARLCTSLTSCSQSSCRRRSLVMGMKPLNKLDEAASKRA